MCGIAGYVAYAPHSEPLAEKTLVAIRDHMEARGPDGHGLWISAERRVGLAHRRLSIIDLSDAAAQPMHDAQGRYVITYNGEIYNFAALKAQLEARGHIFRSESDTETLLQLYAVYGVDMLPMLRGMFAFAIWDQHEESLILARDPYGIKPLYWAQDRGCIRFASQVKALMVDPALSRELSPAGRVGFEMMGSVPEPFTIFKAVKACPSGSYIKVDTSGIGAPVTYARLSDVIAHPQKPTLATTADMLRDSVAQHLVADVEVGAFLSGGVDSGAIIGLMRDCGQNRIKGCTLGFEEYIGTSADEVPRASRIAAHYEVEHHIRMITAQEFADDMPKIFAAMDQPSVDGINSWFVSKACREMGLKVALSGLGGDELLCGYSTFKTVPNTYKYAGPVAHMPGLGIAARHMLQSLMPRLLSRNPKFAGLFEYAGSWAGAYLLRRAILLPFELDQALDPDVAREGLAELRPLGLIGASLVPDPGSDMGRVCVLESSQYMRNQLLRDSDWAGMAHSLEVRVPLVDFTLLGHLAPHLPTLKNGQGKTILANAPSKPLPADIVATPKTGFQIPAANWLSGGLQNQTLRTDSRRSTRTIFDQYSTSLAAPV
jgi:asparagine synthase (glutamine-hydrolysing)